MNGNDSQRSEKELESTVVVEDAPSPPVEEDLGGGDLPDEVSSPSRKRLFVSHSVEQPSSHPFSLQQLKVEVGFLSSPGGSLFASRRSRAEATSSW